MTQQGILSGPEILKQIQEGHITIDPFNEKLLNPASVDLTLGTGVRIYRYSYFKLDMQFIERRLGYYNHQKGEQFPEDGSTFQPYNVGQSSCRDSKNPEHWETDSYTIDPEMGWVLQPGIGYLMHTAERVTTNCYVPVLDGKSSVGRIFVKVHETAGYGDPGFDGHYTLEVTSQLPVKVYPGMRFCQIRFHTIVGEVLSYQEHRSNYKGVSAEGAVASRIYKQFDT